MSALVLSIGSCDLTRSRHLQRRTGIPAVLDEVKEELNATQTLKLNISQLGAHMKSGLFRLS